MVSNLVCELAYRFMVVSWYKKEREEIHNLTQLISKLKGL